MKKNIIALAVVLSIFLSFNAYGLEIKFLTLRYKIFDEAGEIKALLSPKSKDAAIITSMWDSCLTTVMQLDAYFNMIGIFNTIKRQDWNDDAVKFLVNWMDQLKRINGLNISSLDAASGKIDANTRLHLAKLRAYFIELDGAIDAEIDKLSKLRESFKIKGR